MKKRDFSGMDQQEILLAAKKACLNMLERSDKTEMQLRVKLAEAGFPSSAVDGAIAYAASFHYVDDVRFTMNYLQTGLKKKSRRRVEAELLQKGIDRETLDRCLEEMGDHEQCQEKTALDLIIKRTAGKNWEDAAVRRREMQYLAGQGFSYEIIRGAAAQYQQWLEENGQEPSQEIENGEENWNGYRKFVHKS